MAAIPAESTAGGAANLPVVSFDVDVHITQRYSGEAAIQRLLWVAVPHGPQRPLAAPALNNLEPHRAAAWVACLEAIKKQGNIPRYKELYQQYHLLFGSSSSTDESTSSLLLPPYDASWVHEADLSNRQEREMLNGRLHAAQAHLNKEAVRVAYTQLSYHLLRLGDYHEALATALRAKDYCTSRSQTASNSLQILVVALHLRSFPTVAEYAPRLENTVGAAMASNSNGNGNNETAATSSGTTSASTTTAANFGTMVLHKVWLACGLERLQAGDYRKAAAKFRAVTIQRPTQDQEGTDPASGSAMATTASASTTKETAMDDWDRSVLAPDDVALYAAILTMATETRRSTDALALVTSHAESLERVPFLMEILQCWYLKADYRRAWDLLQTNVWPILQNDIYFGHGAQPATSTGSGSFDVTNGGGTTMWTHLNAVQDAMREKALGLYWQAYHSCPLSRMADALGPGIAGPPGSSHLRSTVLRLLTNRRRSDNSNGNTLDPTERYLFPMDTRFDALTDTLVRTVHFDATEERNHAVQANRRQLADTSMRVLNDTYALVVRMACMEQELIVMGSGSSAVPSSSPNRDGGGGKSMRRGRPAPSSRRSHGGPAYINRGAAAPSARQGRHSRAALAAASASASAAAAAVPFEDDDDDDHALEVEDGDMDEYGYEPEGTEDLDDDALFEEDNDGEMIVDDNSHPNEMNPEDLY